MTQQEFLFRCNVLYSEFQDSLYEQKYSNLMYFEDAVVNLMHNNKRLLKQIVQKASESLEDGKFSIWGQVICEIAYIYHKMGYIFDSDCVQQELRRWDGFFQSKINNALEEKSAKQNAVISEVATDPTGSFQDILSVIKDYAYENREDIASLNMFNKCKTEFVLYGYLSDDINHVF